MARRSASGSNRGRAGYSQRGKRLGRPPLDLPDASHKLARLVRAIRKAMGGRIMHAEILAVLNKKSGYKPVSLVYFRSLISPRTNNFRRRLDPAVFALYERALVRHYGVSLPPDSSRELVALVQRIMESKRRKVPYEEILGVLNEKSGQEPLSISRFRRILSPEETVTHRVLDPDVFAFYKQALLKHYRLTYMNVHMPGRLFVPIGEGLWTRDAPAIPIDKRVHSRLAERFFGTASSVIREARRAGHDEVVFIVHVTASSQGRQIRQVMPGLRNIMRCSMKLLTWRGVSSAGAMRRASSCMVRDASPNAADRVLPMDVGSKLLPGAIAGLRIPSGFMASCGFLATSGPVPSRSARAGFRGTLSGRADLAPALVFADVARLQGSLLAAQAFAMPDVPFGPPSPLHDWMFFVANPFIRVSHCLSVTHVVDGAEGCVIPCDESLPVLPHLIAWSNLGLCIGDAERRLLADVSPRVASLFPVPGLPSRDAASSPGCDVVSDFQRSGLGATPLFDGDSSGIALMRAVLGDRARLLDHRVPAGPAG